MSTEYVPDLPPSGGTRSAIRPPDFLLPASEKGSPTRRGGAHLYVSSGGQIYGPATADEAIAGLHSGYFDKDALFCPEASDDWRPLAELTAEGAEPSPSRPDTSRLVLPPPVRRSVPPAGGASHPEVTSKPRSTGRHSSQVSPGAHSGRRRRRERSNAPRGRRNLVGRLIVLGAVLLAVLITAGLLLLISRV